MTTPATHWKTDIDDLRARAALVMDGSDPAELMTARTAARCLSGVMGLVGQQFGLETMRRTCADLVRFEMAWATKLGWLPLVNGSPTKATQYIAIIARGVMPLCGVVNMRAALSFWATETDPAVWVGVAQG